MCVSACCPSVLRCSPSPTRCLSLILAHPSALHWLLSLKEPTWLMRRTVWWRSMVAPYRAAFATPALPTRAHVGTITWVFFSTRQRAGGGGHGVGGGGPSEG